MAAYELQPTPNQGELESPWITAPGGSHVEKFKYFDRSGSEFGASSEVIVCFRSNKGPSACYRYKFGSHERAREVFDALCGSDHPGAVVHSELKEPRVPYIGPFYS